MNRDNPIRAAILRVSAMLPAVALASTIAHADTLYVDDDAPLGGDGQSWATAYRYLQDALATAQPGSGVDEIHVGQGAYKPDRDEAGNVLPGLWTETFQLLNGVTIRGGYAGYGAADPNLRDIEQFETVLSGDLAGDDEREPVWINYEENSWHVLTGSGTDGTVVIDGFTITAGYASGTQWPAGLDSMGAGMFNDGGSPTVLQCTFEWNRAKDGGTGMTNLYGSSPVLTGCVFEHNWAEEGNPEAGAGGGVCNAFGGEPQFLGCVFRYNSAVAGGGMQNVEMDLVIVTDCLFEYNEARNIPMYGVGGGLSFYFSSAVIDGCVFEENAACWSGGLNCGPNTGVIVQSCVFRENSSASSGGGMSVYESDPTIVNCLFVNNSAVAYGGGVRAWTDGHPTIVNCTFSGNEAPNGAGVYNEETNGVTMHNCIVWDNNGPQISGAPAVVTYSDVQGGYLGEGNLNEDPLFDTLGIEPYRLGAGSPCIDAGDSTAVPPGITTDLAGDPRFVDDPSTQNTGVGPPWVDMGAYEFQAATPCPADVNGDGTVDVLDLLAVLAAWGNTSGPEDINGDGIVDVLDLLELLAAWGPCP